MSYHRVVGFDQTAEWIREIVRKGVRSPNRQYCQNKNEHGGKQKRGFPYRFEPFVEFCQVIAPRQFREILNEIFHGKLNGKDQGMCVNVVKLFSFLFGQRVFQRAEIVQRILILLRFRSVGFRRYLGNIKVIFGRRRIRTDPGKASNIVKMGFHRFFLSNDHVVWN